MKNIFSQLLIVIVALSVLVAPGKAVEITFDPTVKDLWELSPTELKGFIWSQQDDLESISSVPSLLQGTKLLKRPRFEKFGPTQYLWKKWPRSSLIKVSDSCAVFIAIKENTTAGMNEKLSKELEQMGWQKTGDLFGTTDEDGLKKHVWLVFQNSLSKAGSFDLTAPSEKGFLIFFEGDQKPTPNKSVVGEPLKRTMPASPSHYLPPSLLRLMPRTNEVSISAVEDAPSIELLGKIASVNGLLVSPLGSNTFAGQAMKITATALPTKNTNPARLSFNQPMGSMMKRSLGEVAKYCVLQYDGWPGGRKIEISFEDKYSEKDGPSAASAFALLMYSLITGNNLDPALAITGDMNADGSIQPIGGVSGKLRGATNSGLRLVCFPRKNRKQLSDVLISEGPEPFAAIQVFTVDSIDEVIPLALKEKSVEVESALAKFDKVRGLYKRQKSRFRPLLQNSKVQAALREVVAALPNHDSARLLLAYANGNVPSQLSLSGSLMQIEDSSEKLLEAITDWDEKKLDQLASDYLLDNILYLKKIRPKLDQRTLKYTNAIIDFGETIHKLLKSPLKTRSSQVEAQSAIKSSVGRVISERNQLKKSPKIQEELAR